MVMDHVERDFTAVDRAMIRPSVKIDIPLLCRPFEPTMTADGLTVEDDGTRPMPKGAMREVVDLARGVLNQIDIEVRGRDQSTGRALREISEQVKWLNGRVRGIRKREEEMLRAQEDNVAQIRRA